MSRRVDLVEHDLPRVLVDLLDLVLVLRILVELQEGGRLEVLFGIEDADAAAQAHDRRGPAALGMPDRAVGAGERQRRLAGQRAFLDEQLAHRHHFPVDLVALGAAQIVEAGLLVGIDLLDGERAALDPGLAQFRDIRRPVEAQRRLHLRGGAIEAGGDVLLAVGHEIGLGVLRIDGDVHAEAEAGRLRHVLDHLHLRAVVAHAIDVGAARHVLRRQVGRDAVDQGVLAALRRVHEFEAVRGIGTREGAEMMADRVVVAVVPVPDRAQHAIGVEIDRVGAAAHLGRQQRDPVAEALAPDVGARVDDFAGDRRLLRAGAGGPDDAVVRRGSTVHGAVAQHGNFGGGGGADGDVQHRAPAHLRLDLGLGRLFAGLARGLLVLGDEIGLELLTVLRENLFVALQEFVDRSLGGRQVRFRTVFERGDEGRDGCIGRNRGGRCFSGGLRHRLLSPLCKCAKSKHDFLENAFAICSRGR